MTAMTPTRVTTVLLVEDNPGDARLIREMLRDGGAVAFAVESVDRLATALDRMRSRGADAVLLDLGLPDSSGLATYQAARRAMPTTPIIVVSGLDDEGVALQAMRAGAQDYLVKGRTDGPVLARAIRHAIERKHAEQELIRAETRFRALVEQSWDGVVILAADGTIKWCSPATTRLLGYDVNECVGRNAIDLIRPDDRDAARRTLRESTSRPKEQITARAQVLHKNGSWRLMEGTFTNLLHEPSVAGIVNNYRDVTEEQASMERARWLSQAIEQSPAAVVLTDENGGIRYVNAKFTETTGYTAAEAIGKNPRFLQSGLTPRKTYERLWQTLTARQQFRGQFQNRRKNGEVYWADVLISPVTDVSGTATRYIGVQTDITKQKAFENELRESNERFAQLAESISEVFFIADAQLTQVLYVNPAFETLWGRSRASLIENPQLFFASIAPEDAAVVAGAIARVQSGEAVSAIDFRVIRPDGAVRWVMAHAIAIRDGNGAVYRMCGVVLDITERKEAQVRLEEASSRFRRLVEASFDAVVISEKGIVLDANPAFARMFGLANEQEAVGRRTRDFASEESVAEVARRSEDGIDGSYEFTGKRKDGKKLLVEVQAKAMTVGGRPARVTALRDVTEQRMLEKQYRQAQKMEAIGRLAGGVAHDFNNLLTVIGGHTELLLEDLSAADPRRSGLEHIGEAAQSAAALTRQLLAFSRRQVIEPTTIALDEAVLRAKKLLTKVIGEDIDVETSFSPQPCPVRIDAGQLDQVLMNLAVNARDAMPTGGRLTFETAIVELQEPFAQLHWPVAPGHYVMLAVTDTGTGMTAEVRERIFEPFFTTKELGKGTGLGLATVYGIVKQSGGSISVYSEPGMGATFKIYFPIADGNARAVLAAAAEAPIPRGQETILLVEDSAGVRAIAKRVLQRQGYVVVEAACGDEALAIAGKPDPAIDLLLTDVVMPRMSGRELAERFREVHPHARTLFMSGYTDDAVVRHGVLNADAPYLQKPFTPKALGSKVREVLDA